MLIDSHAHLSSLPYNEEQMDALLSRAHGAGIRSIININTTEEEGKRGLLLKNKLINIHHAAAITPHDADTFTPQTFSWIARNAEEGALVAIGETGLDYHYYPQTKEAQKHSLKAHLQLARQCHLPVVIHCRAAFDDLFAILDTDYQQESVLIHCFTGTLEEAHQALARGFSLSLSGIVTFNKSKALQEIATVLPLERVLIETDSPYLAPTPYRGKPNEPAYLKEIAIFLAQLRSVEVDEIAAITSKNAHRFFHRSKSS